MSILPLPLQTSQETPTDASVTRPATVPLAEAHISGAPAQLTSFVGREREIAAIREALGSTRLLTLTGTGGSGKTRLALEVVRREVDATKIASAWVELAAVRDPSLVVETVLIALGVRDEGEARPIERVARILGDSPFLLVLDNGEHLVEACAALADTLLRNAPALRIVVTSREALGVTGEVAWLVPPLSLPSPSAKHGDAAIVESEAVQLFVQRATAVVTGFKLTPHNSAAVAQICRRLDGLPLALELAAARLRVLSPDQVAARLDDRFKLLTTGNRAALPRHQTLRAAIDWSYELLDEQERLLLARIAVFGGSFSIEGVEEVCAGGALTSDDVLDLLSSLVEKSLVDVVEAGGIARYRLLETVREYAAARLAEKGELERYARQHAEHYAKLATAADPELRTRQRPMWAARLQAELENFRHVLAWSREHDPLMHIRLVGHLHWFWFSSGQFPEARQWLRGALAMPEAATRTRERAALLFSSGGFAALQAMCETSVPQLEEAESIAESLGEERLLADVRNYLAMSYNALRDPRAEGVALRARPWMRENGDIYSLRLNYLLQGTARLVEGDLAGAIEATEEGVRAARIFGLDRELAIAVQQLALLVLRQGDIGRAVALLRESLVSLRRDPQLLFLARALEYMASSAANCAPSESAQLYGAGDAIRDSIGAKMWSVDEGLHQPFIATARRSAGETAFDAARAAGRALGMERAIELALDLSMRICADPVYEPSTDTAEFEVVQLPLTAVAKSLRVRSLGGLSIELDGIPPTDKGLGYAKARELLVFLLLHPEGRTREQVGVALWPDASAAQVRNNFHVTLHHLRRALGGAEWVRLERERYRLNAPGEVSFDAREFEEAVTNTLRTAQRGSVSLDALSAAVANYRGPFLDGEQAGDWHLEVSDRLTRLHATALHALGNALLDVGRNEEAAEIYDRLIGTEHLDEGAYRALMIARARSGDRAGAIRELRRLEGVLQREVSGSASRETIALARRIEKGDSV